jgi:uncharacterized protein
MLRYLKSTSQWFVTAIFLVTLIIGMSVGVKSLIDLKISSFQFTGSGSLPPQKALAVKAFPPGSVKLLEGPFKEAMSRNAAYLLSLEPDRFLHNFRKFAGLQPKGALYGGWESQGVAGQTLGHYLSACALQYKTSGDTRFKERVDYIVTELSECQRQRTDGYVGGIPDADRIFREVSEGNIRSKGGDLNGGWVPWYTLHKLSAGLNDVYTLLGNETAKDVAIKLADWAIHTTEKLDDAQWQNMLACEYGGMNESLAELASITGEKRFLDLARKFHQKAVLDPLENRRDPLAGLHANTQIPKVIGTAREYEITGEERYKTISETFWNAVVNNHSYCIGGNSDGEHFGSPKKLSNRLSTNTTETCNTYNMLKLTQHLFIWNQNVSYVDFYERALYNHILASQNPVDGMMCYYVSLKPGDYKKYSTPFDSFWCCVGTGIENHTRYAEGIYYHTEDTLFWNLFIASEVKWKEHGIILRQETKFPEENTSRLRIVQGEAEFTLKVRWPSWATAGLTVKVNGMEQKLDGKPGTYVSVRRKWSQGDVIEVGLPMSLHLDAMPDNQSRVALLYGPIVLAGDLGAISQAAPQIPVFVADGKALLQQIKPITEKPLTFRSASVGRPEEVTFLPFYKTHQRRYSVYFDLFTPEAWQQKQAAYEAGQLREKQQELRTIDHLSIGEMQAERDHQLTGEKTATGDFDGRKWRHATEGGWFAFTLNVDSSKTTDLVCSYWGSDAGGREFDILVDGTKIATQVLEKPRPEKFMDIVYPIPGSLTQGKKVVTIRFQAHPGKIAGGLFDCRTLRSE